MEVFHGMDRLERSPVLEPHDLQAKRQSARKILTRGGGDPTHRVGGHSGSECLGHKVVNLLPRLVRQVAGGRARLELKLGPDDQVDDAAIKTIRPVVVEDLEVVVVLERGAAGHDGHVPAQALPQDKVGDAAVNFGQAVGEGLVAAQVRGDALEPLQVVCPDEVADLFPCLGAVLRVGRGDGSEVFGVEPDEERRALGRAFRLGDVDVPEGEAGAGKGDCDVEGTHCLCVSGFVW